MGRLLKIAVYVAILFLGYLWIATVAKSCNKEATADTNTEMTEDIAVSDEFEDDFFEDEEINDGTATTDGMGGGSDDEFEDDDSSPIDYTEIDEIIEKSKPTISKSNTKRPTETTSSTLAENNKTSHSTSTSGSGKFMLLAGSYLMEDNAKIMVRKLKKLGYSNAEMVIFDMSQYHSVCAGRYTSLSSAQQESSALKRKGVDNYVHTRQ